MNFLVRNADPVYVRLIDEKAKKRGMSRNEYINRLIAVDCETNEMAVKEDKFERALMNVNKTLDRQADTLQHYINTMEETIRLVLSEHQE